ncbi:UNVERIFIED_CONTAM: hypothetical protein FKN15_043403 [Acipenser sinensis]
MAARGDLSDFERGVIVGERLAGASVTETAQLADVSQAAVSKVMSSWNSEGMTSSAKGNSGRKRILQDRDIRAFIPSTKTKQESDCRSTDCEFQPGTRAASFIKNGPTRTPQSRIPEWLNALLSDFTSGFPFFCPLPVHTHINTNFVLLQYLP